MESPHFTVRSLVVFLASELALAAIVIYFNKSWLVLAISSIALFAVLWLWDRRKRMEPWYLIVVGLAGIILSASIALGGFIWQYRSSSPVLSAPEISNNGSTTFSVQPEGTSQDVRREPHYTSEDIDSILKMLADVNQIQKVTLKSILEEVRDECQPWNMSDAGQSGSLAELTITKLQKSDEKLTAAHQKLFGDLRTQYSLYWDISLNIINSDQSLAKSPTLQLMVAIERLIKQLNVYIELEKNLVKKPDQNLLKMVQPSLEETFLAAGAMDEWIANSGIRIKNESDAFRAK